ncbi:hypothetical protein EKO27_g10879 [Xylaria grammica]|uniref:Uncharacterized protein n=1 Tax=Xylaria grammica TaxID=363999 RepID=A0A439CPZ2_9PEZI|nr:hypothetical protein EKO27_g10879 [Xylaria grammica]
MARFTGKTALVTGAGSGLGAEVAKLLALEEAKVIALDIKFPDTPDEPSSITRRQLDVTIPEQWDELVTSLTNDGVEVDILINAAGVLDNGNLHELELDSWRHILAVDVDGVMLGMRAIIPQMKARGRGAIVNFSSILADVSLIGSPAYHAAKGAVTNLTRNAAVTYAPDNVRVNAIHPGIIATPMVANQPKKFIGEALGRTPMGRMGTTREIATVVLFIASDDASFMTGSAVAVDGGFTAH